MRRINWGIIGLGNIANKFSKEFDKIGNAKLLAVASKNNYKLKNFGEYFNIEEKFLFKNYQDLINCNDLDIIYIALPNSLHKKWILKAIENKKNVLVEKPATINLSEAMEIKECLKDSKVLFTEAFMYRYHPQINSIIKIIENNKIGNLLSMESSFGINILSKKKFFFFNQKKKINSKSRLFDKQLGGGCILDLGCYPSSFSLLIGSLKNKLNENNFRLSKIFIERGETGVDIDCSAELEFQDGFKSKINSSFKRSLGNKSIIYGENGSIIVNNTWFGGDVILRTNGNAEKIINFETDKNIYNYQIEEISKILIDRLSKPNFPIVSLDETLSNMKIIDNWLNF
tara:strand:+ start:127 stop:1155 length:1029 start_codon:yes stop_codon:yes gene_type:complete